MTRRGSRAASTGKSDVDWTAMGLTKNSLAALIATALIAACSRSEPAPPISNSSAGSVVIGKGDTDAAIANVRAVLAEMETHQVDYAAVGADLLEGILNEDPRLIGTALTRLAKSLPMPKKSPPRATGDR